jgi:crotonobetainyl-CoA:carnitine CoA-transferase CaiB-like acyl-CoA transferase
MTTKLLEGVRVAEFCSTAAGPFCAMLLADMGAEVVKVEPPEGDGLRQWPPIIGGYSENFAALNRNKKSVALDLKDPAAAQLARLLVLDCDVLVENNRPGVMDRLGLGYETLAERNPGLVFCSSSGYGQSGPYVKRPGQDLLIQSLSGFTYLNGRAGDPPVPVGLGVADLVTGLGIVYGVLAALVSRAQSGRGQRVETDLLSSLVAFQGQEIAAYLETGRMPERSAAGISSPSTGAPYGVHKTTDGYLALAMNPLAKLAPLIGLEGPEAEMGLNQIEGRDDIQRRIAERIATRSTGEWLEILLADDIWCAPVQDYEAMSRDPQVLHNGSLIDIDHPTAGTFRTPGPSVRFSDTPIVQRLPPPLLGEHSEELLRDVLGLGDEEISALRGSGALGPAAAAD